jgi:hypothetical protein
LDRRPVGQWVAEGHAQLDDVSARIRKSQNKPQCGAERWIARRDVRNDAEFATCAEFAKSFGDTGRVGGRIEHRI